MATAAAGSTALIPPVVPFGKATVPAWLQAWNTRTHTTDTELMQWKQLLDNLAVRLSDLKDDTRGHTVPEALAKIYQPYAPQGVQLSSARGGLDVSVRLTVDKSVALKGVLPYLAANTRGKLGETFQTFIEPLGQFVTGTAAYCLGILQPPAPPPMYEIPNALPKPSVKVQLDATSGVWKTKDGPSSYGTAAVNNWLRRAAVAKASPEALQSAQPGSWREALTRALGSDPELQLMLQSIDADISAAAASTKEQEQRLCRLQAKEVGAAAFLASLFGLDSVVADAATASTATTTSPIVVTLKALLDASGVNMSPEDKWKTATTLSTTCYQGGAKPACLDTLTSALGDSILGKLERIGFQFGNRGSRSTAK